jgi:hypothetical protein
LYNQFYFDVFFYSVTFLLPSPDQNCDDGQNINSKTIKSSSSSHRTSSFTTTTTTRYEHRTMIKNVSQFSPSGGRYSILNRDFSLKESTENVARSISLWNKLYHFFTIFTSSWSNFLAFWIYKWFVIIVSCKLFYDFFFILLNFWAFLELAC